MARKQRSGKPTLTWNDDECLSLVHRDNIYVEKYRVSKGTADMKKPLAWSEPSVSRLFDSMKRLYWNDICGNRQVIRGFRTPMSRTKRFPRTLPIQVEVNNIGVKGKKPFVSIWTKDSLHLLTFDCVKAVDRWIDFAMPRKDI